MKSEEKYWKIPEEDERTYTRLEKEGFRVDIPDKNARGNFERKIFSMINGKEIIIGRIKYGKNPPHSQLSKQDYFQIEYNNLSDEGALKEVLRFRDFLDLNGISYSENPSRESASRTLRSTLEPRISLLERLSQKRETSKKEIKVSSYLKEGKINNEYEFASKKPSEENITTLDELKKMQVKILEKNKSGGKLRIQQISSVIFFDY